MISEMAKSDMLLLLEALDYTAEQTKIKAYSQLRDNILDELSNITGLPREKVPDFLET